MDQSCPNIFLSVLVILIPIGRLGLLCLCATLSADTALQGNWSIELIDPIEQALVEGTRYIQPSTPATAHPISTDPQHQHARRMNKTPVKQVLDSLNAKLCIEDEALSSSIDVSAGRRFSL